MTETLPRHSTQKTEEEETTPESQLSTAHYIYTQLAEP